MIIFSLLVIGAGALTRGFLSTKDIVVLANDGMPSVEELYKPIEFQHKEVAVEEAVKAPQPTTTPVASVKPKKSLNHVQEAVKKQNDVYFGEDHWEALHELLMRESGFRTEAQNPKSTAYGIFQFLDSTWKGVGCKKTSDLHEQIECGMRYLKNRYKNPTNALEFHNENKWY